MMACHETRDENAGHLNSEDLSPINVSLLPYLREEIQKVKEKEEYPLLMQKSILLLLPATVMTG